MSECKHEPVVFDPTYPCWWCTDCHKRWYPREVWRESDKLRVEVERLKEICKKLANELQDEMCPQLNVPATETVREFAEYLREAQGDFMGEQYKHGGKEK